MGIADGLAFRTKGQLAIDICTDAYADGVAFDVACGDEVYGNCTPLRQFFENQQQAYVLRVASTFMLTLNPEIRTTCARAVCAIAAARLKTRTDTQAPPPSTPDQQPPAEPGMISLTIPETKRLLATTRHQPKPADHDTHWRNWRRRHQARARWFHQRTRLNREYSLAN